MLRVVEPQQHTNHCHPSTSPFASIKHPSLLQPGSLSPLQPFLSPHRHQPALPLMSAPHPSPCPCRVSSFTLIPLCSGVPLPALSSLHPLPFLLTNLSFSPLPALCLPSPFPCCSPSFLPTLSPSLSEPPFSTASLTRKNTGHSTGIFKYARAVVFQALKHDTQYGKINTAGILIQTHKIEK
ncbi:hypothetical protein Pcinc_031364 [Petrolisthes cinctipes]|uniref:Uncharacterized protein n=1 Tax=Petrolisthes cinctipes TaxID=88211 RepID=A0AAE1K2R1_PETCI|nr:hypothetical protein Pcinc_031364 [Petrolisthes cinctipes]